MCAVVRTFVALNCHCREVVLVVLSYRFFLTCFALLLLSCRSLSIRYRQQRVRSSWFSNV